MRLFEFFGALFRGEAGEYLVDTLWPWIQSILETIALTFMILPLTMMKHLKEVIGVFSGTRNIEATSTITTSVSSAELANMSSFESMRVQAAGMQITQTVTEEVSFLEYFMNQPFITRAFWGITLIALALCLAFSIIAVLRSMGDLQQNRPLGKVIGSIGKAMLTFLLVPFLCISAILLTTIVMRQTEVFFSGEAIYGEEVSVEGAILISSVQPEHVRMWDVTRVWKHVKLPGGDVIHRGHTAGFGPQVNQHVRAMRADARYKRLYAFCDEHGGGYDGHYLHGKKASEHEMYNHSLTSGFVEEHLEWINGDIVKFNLSTFLSYQPSLIEKEMKFVDTGDILGTPLGLADMIPPDVNEKAKMMEYVSQGYVDTYKAMIPMIEKICEEAEARVSKYLAVLVSDYARIVAYAAEKESLAETASIAYAEASAAYYELVQDNLGWRFTQELAVASERMRNAQAAYNEAQEAADDAQLIVIWVDALIRGGKYTEEEQLQLARITMAQHARILQNLSQYPSLEKYTHASSALGLWEDYLDHARTVLQASEDFTWYAEQVTGKGWRLIEERKKIDEDDYTPELQRELYDRLVREYMFGHRGVGFSDMADIRYDFDVFHIFFGGIGIFTSITAWFMLILLIMIVLVFIRRIFEVVVLYVVSPFFVSAIPLDDGKRFSGWRDAFVSRLLSGFGSLFMLQIFIIMLPMIWSPDLTLSSNPTADTLMKLFFMAGGMFTIWKSHTLISTILNPQAAAAEQESAAGMLAFGGMALGAGISTVAGGANVALGAYSGIKARYGGESSDSGSSASSDPGPKSSGNANPNL